MAAKLHQEREVARHADSAFESAVLAIATAAHRHQHGVIRAPTPEGRREDAKVRKAPSWPRSWANFSLSQLCSRRNA